MEPQKSEIFSAVLDKIESSTNSAIDSEYNSSEKRKKAKMKDNEDDNLSKQNNDELANVQTPLDQILKASRA